MPRREICRFAWLGTVEYIRARTLQDTLVRQVRDGDSPDTLLLLEHPHVYTKGRLSREEHLLASEAELVRVGVPVHETDRGGQITYHGPGQLIGYPVINLRDLGGGPSSIRPHARKGDCRYTGGPQHRCPYCSKA